MRIGLIADIHGNLIALDAVLAALAIDAVEIIVCLGDVAALGPQPGDVIDRLREVNALTVIGNTDRWLTDAVGPPSAEPPSGWMAAQAAWCAALLRPDQRTYLATLPMVATVTVPNNETLGLFHASPTSLDAVLRPGDSLSEDERQTLRSSAIVAYGHTHVAAVWQNEQTLIVNPGSVGLAGIGPGGPGLPKHRDVTWSEFAILEVTEDERRLTLRRTAVERSEMIDIARHSGMPGVEDWRRLWREADG